jgi:hypothetical protein
MRYFKFRHCSLLFASVVAASLISACATRNYNSDFKKDGFDDSVFNKSRLIASCNKFDDVLPDSSVRPRPGSISIAILKEDSGGLKKHKDYSKEEWEAKKKGILVAIKGKTARSRFSSFPLSNSEAVLVFTSKKTTGKTVEISTYNGSINRDERFDLNNMVLDNSNDNDDFDREERLKSVIFDSEKRTLNLIFQSDRNGPYQFSECESFNLDAFKSL